MKGKKMDKIIEITDPKEMEKFVKTNKYLLVDDGMDEFIIKESDLPNYIYNRNENVNVYKSDGEFLLSTFGYFLNKIPYSYRQTIIERLMDLQLGNKESKYKKIRQSQKETRHHYTCRTFRPL